MAERYMSNKVKMSYRYWTSLKKTYIADKIKPMPMLNVNKLRMG